MNIKTYITKINTIEYNSPFNHGSNPICELYYGDGYSRILLQINVDKVNSLISDKTFSDTSKIKHVLKLKNCWGLQSINKKYLRDATLKERTSSFEILLVRIPEPWDGGSGIDSTNDGFINVKPIISENASNWFNSKTNTPWFNSGGVINVMNEENIITRQLFDIGNEDVEMDITNEINDIINCVTDNNGFMLCFANGLEGLSTTITQYVGFFTNNSNTFFKPYLETSYNETIIDDRNQFYLNKNNKLYFYSLIGGCLTNLDALPECSIGTTNYTVKQATKGVYYIDIMLDNTYNENDMLYDMWSNIIYKGTVLNDVEQEFVIKPNNYFNFQGLDNSNKRYIPSVYGIKNGEKINGIGVRKIFINPRSEYTTNVVEYITNIKYRLYVKEYNKEIEVIKFSPVNLTPTANYFMLDLDSLIPNTYYIDIRIERNDESIIHKNKLSFQIINEII